MITCKCYSHDSVMKKKAAVSTKSKSRKKMDGDMAKKLKTIKVNTL